VVVETPTTPKIFLKRVYETPSPQDGRRILVDRLWPRGVSKAAAQLDGWMKDVAPSTALRKWFDHRPERWPEFRRRYICELKSNPSLRTLGAMVAGGPVTLLYAARDTAHNEAVVLAEQLSATLVGQGAPTGSPAGRPKSG
jgi:uncharacterized protein YeaO (DUF488 family)